MNKDGLYKSVLAPYITDFINEKHSLGYKYITGFRIMRRFDEYWFEHGYGEIGLTVDNLTDWIQKRDSENVGQLRTRIVVVRQFSIYLNGLSIPSYIPPLEIRCEKPFRHLLTKREIKELFTQIDAYMPNGKGVSIAYKRMADEYPVLFRLIYLNGMRISEACRLPVSQVD